MHIARDHKKSFRAAGTKDFKDFLFNVTHEGDECQLFNF